MGLMNDYTDWWKRGPLGGAIAGTPPDQREPWNVPALAAGFAGPSVIKGVGLADTLAMDTASRMARAQQLGFTTPAYHGTKAPEFNAFNPALTQDIGMHFGTLEQATTAAKQGAFLNDTPRVMDVRLKLQNPLRTNDLFSRIGTSKTNVAKQLFFDTPGFNPTQAERDAMMSAARKMDGILKRTKGLFGLYNDASDSVKSTYKTNERVFWDTVQQSAQRQGYDGLVYNNAVEGAGDSYAVFQPNQVRLADAAFDPAAADSPDLLAGAGAVPLASTPRKKKE